MDIDGKSGESMTETRSLGTEFIKHIESIELVNPPLGKPSIRVPPLRFTFFKL
jgi:hypothetical protein